MPEVGHRFEGYRRALAARDIPEAPPLVMHTPFMDGSAAAAVSRLVDEKVRFDAVFASSDMLAIETLDALRRHGRSVPGDVAVVGYDDIMLARYTHPPLTTIRQPVASGADALVDSLLKIVAGSRPDTQLLTTELIVRASSLQT
jgi:DNA-binding LacI/PurR family transcriptional regulator